MHFIYDEIGNYHMLLIKNIKHDIFVLIEKKECIVNQFLY